jgi:hypothetical protein
MSDSFGISRDLKEVDIDLSEFDEEEEEKKEEENKEEEKVEEEHDDLLEGNESFTEVNNEEII